MKRWTAIAFVVAMVVVGACESTAGSPAPTTPADELAPDAQTVVNARKSLIAGPPQLGPGRILEEMAQAPR